MDFHYYTAPQKRISAANSKKEKTLKHTFKPTPIKKVRNNALALWTYTIVQLPLKESAKLIRIKEPRIEYAKEYVKTS